MSYGAFTDKAHPPAEDEVLAALGSRRSDWQELLDLARQGYRCREEFKFYGVNFGWALRLRKGGRALLSLYPSREAFTAGVVLGPSLVPRALALDLAPAVRGALERATDYPEGRWLFISVESPAVLADIRRLVELKAGPPKYRAEPAPPYS